MAALFEESGARDKLEMSRRIQTLTNTEGDRMGWGFTMGTRGEGGKGQKFQLEAVIRLHKKVPV